MDVINFKTLVLKSNSILTDKDQLLKIKGGTNGGGFDISLLQYPTGG